MTTVQNVFDITMSLIDQRLETGLVDVDATLIYQKNTPYLLTLLQDEIADIFNYTKNALIEESDETDGYVKVTLPTDYKQLFVLKDENFERLTDYKELGEDLYVPYNFSGYLVYRPVLASLTAMTDTLVLRDDVCRNVLSKGLASKLLTNENANLANYFNDLYEEAKNERQPKRPAPIEKIKNVYDSKLTY